MKCQNGNADMVSLITKGKFEPFGMIANHIDVNGILRYALMSNRDFEGEGFHVACHVLTKDYYQDRTDFAVPHTHDFDEFNILLPLGPEMEYEIELEGEKQKVKAPATVFIPAGTEHNARPLAGEGIFICIQLDNKSQMEISALKRQLAFV
ncbi:MAG: hypothetical protein EP344_19875 [Bacteroidetes bacterium]|nr:MAG: hypothetical protein EP344_19875 [Bacteroidota bacterium]